MARQKTETTIKTEQDDIATPGLPAMVEALDVQALSALTANENAQAIAEQLGYDGDMTVGALEDGIRFYQRRTAEACLELGKRLLILKELSPHGEFIPRIEMLGFTARATQKFMQAAFKFSKSANLALLAEKVGTQSKLLELVTMDDDDLESLASGETVRGLELDELDTLTTSQLKAKLRETQANYNAQGKVLADKSVVVDKLATQLNAKNHHVTHAPPDEIAQALRTQAMTDAFVAEHAVAQRLGVTFQALAEHALDNGGDHAQFMLGLLVQIQHEINKVREDFNLQGDRPILDQVPWWEKPEAIAAAEAAQIELQANMAEINKGH